MGVEVETITPGDGKICAILNPIYTSHTAKINVILKIILTFNRHNFADVSITGVSLLALAKHKLTAQRISTSIFLHFSAFQCFLGSTYPKKGQTCVVHYVGK